MDSTRCPPRAGGLPARRSRYWRARRPDDPIPCLDRGAVARRLRWKEHFLRRIRRERERRRVDDRGRRDVLAHLRRPLRRRQDRSAELWRMWDGVPGDDRLRQRRLRRVWTGQGELQRQLSRSLRRPRCVRDVRSVVRRRVELRLGRVQLRGRNELRRSVRRSAERLRPLRPLRQRMWQRRGLLGRRLHLSTGDHELRRQLRRDQRRPRALRRVREGVRHRRGVLRRRVRPERLPVGHDALRGRVRRSNEEQPALRRVRTRVRRRRGLRRRALPRVRDRLVLHDVPVRLVRRRHQVLSTARPRRRADLSRARDLSVS